jgi:hypothetical protein
MGHETISPTEPLVVELFGWKDCQINFLFARHKELNAVIRLGKCPYQALPQK